jgi:hypothetical protein
MDKITANLEKFLKNEYDKRIKNQIKCFESKIGYEHMCYYTCINFYLCSKYRKKQKED